VIALALLAVLLCGVAIAAITWGVVLPRTRMAARLDQLGSYGYSAAQAAPMAIPEPPARGIIASAALRLGEILSERVGRAAEAELRQDLLAAGLYTTSPRTLVGYRALGVIVGLCCGFVIGGSLVVSLLFGACFGALGWILPLTYVRRKGRLRAAVIDREVPDMIDQVVVTLEAGVGFASSLQLAAERLSGPLGVEMRLTLQEQRMGLPLSQSLIHLRDRVDSFNVRSFTRAVTQGERLGVSIGAIMRELAVDMRKRRRQAAEEQARKTPVKILIPLVFFILPSMFVVLLGPAVIKIVDQLSHTG
jgi:tight adherence protein C